jgi:hypothetical protein
VAYISGIVFHNGNGKMETWNDSWEVTQQKRKWQDQDLILNSKRELRHYIINFSWESTIHSQKINSHSHQPPLHSHSLLWVFICVDMTIVVVMSTNNQTNILRARLHRNVHFVKFSWWARACSLHVGVTDVPVRIVSNTVQCVMWGCCARTTADVTSTCVDCACHGW